MRGGHGDARWKIAEACRAPALVYARGNRRPSGERELARAGPCRLGKPRTALRSIDERANRRARRAWSSGWHEHRGVAPVLAQACDVAEDEGAARGGRFQHRQPERLVSSGQRVDRGLVVPVAQHLRGQRAKMVDGIRHGAPRPSGRRGLACHIHRPWQRRCCRTERLDVLGFVPDPARGQNDVPLRRGIRGIASTAREPFGIVRTFCSGPYSPAARASSPVTASRPPWPREAHGQPRPNRRPIRAEDSLHARPATTIERRSAHHQRGDLPRQRGMTVPVQVNERPASPHRQAPSATRPPPPHLPTDRASIRGRSPFPHVQPAALCVSKLVAAQRRSHDRDRDRHAVFGESRGKVECVRPHPADAVRRHQNRGAPPAACPDRYRWEGTSCSSSSASGRGRASCISLNSWNRAR